MKSQTIRKCQRCHSNRKGKKQIRCKNRTCRTARKCWRHLMIENGLRVKNSTIKGAGLGLFTTKDLKANVIVDSYKAKLPILTLKQIHQRYPGNTLGQYVWCHANKCVDARSTQSNLARFSNGCDSTRSQMSRCNAQITKQGNLKTTKKIKANSEILCRYGPEYWGRKGRKG